jgi:hypothetical protein
MQFAPFVLVADTKDYDLGVFVMLMLRAVDGCLADEPGDHGKEFLGRAVVGLEPLFGGGKKETVEAGFFSHSVVLELFHQFVKA